MLRPKLPTLNMSAPLSRKNATRHSARELPRVSGVVDKGPPPLISPRAMTSRSPFRPPRQHYPIVPTRLKDAEEQFNALSSYVREFSTSCSINTIQPNFMADYAMFEREFHLFIQYAIHEINSARPYANERAAFKTSGLYKAAEKMIGQWTDFINLLNSIIEQGLTPMCELLIQYFTNMLQTLNEVSTIFPAGNYKSDVCIGEMRKIKTNLITTKKAAINFMTNYNDMSEEEEEIAQKLAKKMKQINTEILLVCNHLIPKSTMTTGEMMRVKTALNLACGDVIRIILGAAHYITMAAQVKMEIYNLNNQFDKLFDELGLDCHVELTFNQTVPENIPPQSLPIEINSFTKNV